LAAPAAAAEIEMIRVPLENCNVVADPLDPAELICVMRTAGSAGA
jgi:hypothetical protein